MKVVMVGQMAAVAAGLGPVAELMLSRGHQVEPFLPGGKSFSFTTKEIGDAVRWADVLVTGMGDTPENAEYELVAINEAIKHNVCFGCYADTYDVHSHPWFVNMRADASFLFVPDSGEAQEAKAQVWKGLVIASGNPTWEDFVFPTEDRASVRSKLNLSRD